MKFTKEDARRIVLNCAKQYQQRLLNNWDLMNFGLKQMEQLS